MIDWQDTIGRALYEDTDPNSHVEFDSHTFHPSQIAKCKRQCYLSKLGLDGNGPKDLGNFLTGTLLHEWLEETVQPLLGEAAFEVSIDHVEDDIRWVGHTDCWDLENEILYDFKTRGDWFGDNYGYLDPPVERHLNQLTIYCMGLEVKDAKIVYLNKKNIFEGVQEWPEEETWNPTWDRYYDLIRKAREVKQAIEKEGIVTSEEDIPFEKCGCWICDNEELSFDGVLEKKQKLDSNLST